MEIRFAREEDLEQVNALRRQVNELHVSGRPDVFKPGFPAELHDYIHEIFRDPRKRILVCESGGRVRAFAVLNHVTRPETPFMFVRDHLEIDELGVDAAYRRQGVAARMIDFIRAFAKREGFRRIELNMWEFNRGALAFYEAEGFTTYRRYLELTIPDDADGTDDPQG